MIGNDLLADGKLQAHMRLEQHMRVNIGMSEFMPFEHAH